MKKQILKNLFVIMAILSPFFAAAQATTITFSGTGFLTANNWTTHSGTTGQLSSLATTSDVGNSLSYSGLPTSTNNRTTTIAGNSEDVNYVVSTITNAGSVYYSTLIKLTNTTGQAANTTTGNYFMNLADTNGTVVTTGFVGRLYVRAGVATNTFNLGVLNNSGGTALAANIYGATPVDYAINTTYLVVVKYTYATNTASLWVNPTVSATEPTALFTTNFGTGAAPTKSKGICIRQAGTATAGTGNVEIDEIRVANNWSDVLGIAAIVNPSLKFNPTTLSVNENAGTAAVTLNITNPNATATSVDVKVKGGTATAGSDYTFTTQTVTFPANSTTAQTFNIPIIDDASQEGDETIQLVLRNAGNAASILADSILTITIPKNDQPVQAKFVPTTSNVLETAATTGVSINVLGASSNANATTFQVVVKGGTATAGTDYTFSTTTVTIPAYKDSTVNLTAAILNDMLVEGNETIITFERGIGNLLGQDLPAGTYYYSVMAILPSGEVKKFAGPVTLIR